MYLVNIQDFIKYLYRCTLDSNIATYNSVPFASVSHVRPIWHSLWCGLPSIIMLTRNTSIFLLCYFTISDVIERCLAPYIAFAGICVCSFTSITCHNKSEKWNTYIRTYIYIYIYITIYVILLMISLHIYKYIYKYTHKAHKF